MSNELYLICHKVRGEPAFDIAERIPCFMCQEQESVTGMLIEPRWPQAECTECDGLGYQWQIPTSGHRAYPWWHTELFHEDFKCVILLEADSNGMCEVPLMPDGLPDHYTTRAAPQVSLSEALGLTTRKAPSAPIKRRF